MAAPLPDGSVGIPYGPVQVEASGGTPPYQWSACALPRDLYINPDGTIEGVPAFDQYGFFECTVTCDDNAGFTAYGVKSIIISAAASMSALYHGYAEQTGTVDVGIPGVDDGELNMILLFATRTTPAGVPTPPTIAGWTPNHPAGATGTYQAWRWDRVHQTGDPSTVTVDFGASWTGLAMGLGFYFGDPTNLVSAFTAIAAGDSLSLNGITPDGVSDAMSIAVAHYPVPVTQGGWEEDLGVGYDEFIGWPVAQSAYMQWPDAEVLAGPIITPQPQPMTARMAGWTFAMARG